MPFSPIIRYAVAGIVVGQHARPRTLMSQWRRGTPSVPAPIMNSEIPATPMPNR